MSLRLPQRCLSCPWICSDIRRLQLPVHIKLPGFPSRMSLAGHRMIQRNVALRTSHLPLPPMLASRLMNPSAGMLAISCVPGGRWLTGVCDAKGLAVDDEDAWLGGGKLVCAPGLGGVSSRLPFDLPLPCGGRSKAPLSS